MSDDFFGDDRFDIRRSKRHKDNTGPFLAAFAALLGLALVAVGFSAVVGGGGSATPAAPTTISPPSSPTTAPVASQPTSTPQPAPTPPPVPQPIAFDRDLAMKELRAIESYGVRKAGSPAERAAAEYVARRLRDLGYTPVIEEYPLTDGRISVNVLATVEGIGTSDSVVILGGHIDSKAPSPGANDNASGCAVMLELARIFAQQPVAADVQFVFFGSEEIHDSNPDHHHFGSRYRVKKMSDAEQARTAGMISIDMIGFGPDFVVRTMNRGPQDLRHLILAEAKRLNVPLFYERDPGKTGWSDHEAFELAGIPAAWIERREDPVYHTEKDTSAHIKPEYVESTGDFVLEFMRGLDDDKLSALRNR